MALQTDRLVMIGLGIESDTPPNSLQPPLVNGVHLRWHFKRQLGFPWHGFYLFRRPHREGKPICLSESTTALPLGEWPDNRLTVSGHGELSSEKGLLLTDEFLPTDSIEFDLDGREFVRFRFVPGDPVRCIEARIGFREPASIEVTALLHDVPVNRSMITGNAGDTVTATLEFDAITEVMFSSGPAVLVDLCAIPVSQDAAIGWDLVPDIPYPMCLPVRHPDYPCTLGMSEDLAAMREEARNLIRYGDPDRFTAPPVEVYTSGEVSVTKDSPIVTGSGTDWTQELIGQVLHVSGDPAAYAILMIVSPDKLVLSRNYGGVSAAAKAYAIDDDAFGELHDYLVHLVAGGPASADMASRSIPVVIHSAGVVAVENGSPLVTGSGTDWGVELSGLEFQIADAPVDAQPTFTIAKVNSPTELVLTQDYVGATASDKSYSIRAALGPTESARPAPRMRQQHPLDLVLLSSLEPAVAQMAGLFWVDQHAAPGAAFDYLIVADYDGRFSGQDPRDIIGQLQQTGFGPTDGYIVFNKRVAPASKLPPPDGLRVYALPSSYQTNKDGGVTLGNNNAGLRWDLGTTAEGTLLPDKPIMYHLWRADLGQKEPAAPPPTGQYQLISVANDSGNVSTEERTPRPILVTSPPDAEPQRPADWPPLRMHGFDRGLVDGWYGYLVSGIDLFGRHSPHSGHSQWYQWEPAPYPRPWYFKDESDGLVVHPFAANLLDKIPPPPPAGVEAEALDPQDPLVLKDAAYHAWWDSLEPDERESIVGLRVRWLWTHAHMRQAPDTREFRIYYHPNLMNARSGRTGVVSAFSDTESQVETDIPNSQPADMYVGCRLQIGSNAFVIVASEEENPLRLRVRNIGTGDDVRPGANSPCTLVIPSNYTAGRISAVKDSPTVTGTATGWRAELVGRTLKVVGAPAEYTILSVDSDTQRITLDRPYEGGSADDKYYIIKHPLYVDESISTNWQSRLYVVDYDDANHMTETTDEQGRPLRKFELFLPAAGDANRDGLPLSVSAANPIAYAHIGVSAADDKTHTVDGPKWDEEDWGGRFGNEGRVGGPAKIFRVLRKPPDPPTPPPPDSDKVFATPADYHGHSYYTYRWLPQPHLKTHIFRALDDAVFKADWTRRPRPPLDPNDAADLKFFPSEEDEPIWNEDKRHQVADELNQLNDFSHDAAGTTQASAYYRELSNDAQRALAGLPGNEQAFTQLTIQPLNSNDLETTNRPGPDNPADFSIDPDLRIFINTLDGRSSNHYFYRSAYVDGVHNRSLLSISSPPVYLPDVVPPRAPVFTRVLGGDGVIKLRWASNRETDLIDYRVYRADHREASRDIRLMTLVHTEFVPPGAPAEAAFEDENVVSARTYFYRLVAVNSAGIASTPSPAVFGRAFDDSLPVAPTLEVAWVSDEGTLRTQASWTSADECLLQRRTGNAGLWENVTTPLLPGTHSVIDVDSDSEQTYQYRLRVRKETGAMAIGDSVIIEPQD